MTIRSTSYVLVICSFSVYLQYTVQSIQDRVCGSPLSSSASRSQRSCSASVNRIIKRPRYQRGGIDDLMLSMGMACRLWIVYIWCERRGGSSGRSIWATIAAYGWLPIDRRRRLGEGGRMLVCVGTALPVEYIIGTQRHTTDAVIIISWWDSVAGHHSSRTHMFKGESLPVVVTVWRQF